MAKFLDLTGMEHLLNKIQEWAKEKFVTGRTVSSWSTFDDSGNHNDDVYELLHNYHSGIFTGNGSNEGMPKNMTPPVWIFSGGGVNGNEVFTMLDSAGQTWTGIYHSDNEMIDGPVKIDSNEETITTNGWEIGAFTASGADYEGSTSRFRYSKPIKIPDFIAFTYNYADWYIRYYYFDAGQTFLSDTGWIDGAESQYTEDTVFPEDAAYFKLLARKHDNKDISLSDLADFNPVITIRKPSGSEETTYLPQYVPAKWQNIAYSSFGSYAGNSTEFFKNNSKYKFDMLKCDVQPTSDGKLVLCHDDGFTLNTDGRIISYDADDNTLIRSMTYEMAMSYQYARQVDGLYCSVCDIDTFLEICKSSGIPPFITVRDQYMDEVASALAESLTKYGLTDVTVINSSTRSSLSTVRNYMPNVTVCVFCNPFGSSMAAAYNFVTQNKNAILSYYYNQSNHTWEEFIADQTIAGYINQCNAQGIPQIACIESNLTHTEDLVKMGFDGCLLMGYDIGLISGDGLSEEDVQNMIDSSLGVVEHGTY